MSEADAIEAAARVLRPGMSVDQAARAAYAAIAPIVRRDVAEELAECMEGAPEGIVGTNHRGCPCVKRGGHLAHRCRCGTEWWWTEPVCTCPLIDVTRIDGGEPEYVRGDPKGCDVHGGERKRADDEARRKARTA